MVDDGRWMLSELCTPAIPTCPSPGQSLTPHPKTQRPSIPVPPAPQLRLLLSLIPAPAGCPFKAPPYPFKFYFFQTTFLNLADNVAVRQEPYLLGEP